MGLQEYLEGGDFILSVLTGTDWKDAMRNASLDNLDQLVSGFGLAEEKLAFLAEVLPGKFTDGHSWRLNDEEYGHAVRFVLRMLENPKYGTDVRRSLFKALDAAVRARSGHDSLQNSTGVFIDGLKGEPEIAALCAEVLGNTRKRITSDEYAHAEEAAVPALVNGLSRQEPEVVAACTDALATRGANRGSEPLYAENAVPALEDCAKRMKKAGRKELHYKIRNAIDAIKEGILRGDTEYCGYLGDGETLRVPMFSMRPVPGNQAAADKKKRQKTR